MAPNEIEISPKPAAEPGKRIGQSFRHIERVFHRETVEISAAFDSKHGGRSDLAGSYSR